MQSNDKQNSNNALVNKVKRNSWEMSQAAETATNPQAATTTDVNSVSYLVQYNTNADCLVQSIVPRTAISWPLGNLTVGKRVLVRDAQTHRLAVLVCRAKSFTCQAAAEKLRQQCQQHVAGLPVHLRYQKSQPLEAHSWLLVYYNCGKHRKVYAVIDVNALVWRGKNYSCPFIRANDGQLYEAGIWCCSKTLLELEQIINALRSQYAALLPLGNATAELEDEMQDEHCLNYYCHYLRLDDKQRLLKSLDRLEAKLKHDSADIENTTKAIARSCRKLDRILNKLNCKEVF